MPHPSLPISHSRLYASTHMSLRHPHGILRPLDPLPAVEPSKHCLILSNPQLKLEASILQDFSSYGNPVVLVYTFTQTFLLTFRDENREEIVSQVKADMIAGKTPYTLYKT